ncbi:hypothetical protein COCON_G00071010 [Conger conger]|uniref:Uncharacterized protein n=1 Tax=Conger conger TaxID=82655 RepID=A0A9Q1DTA5_CONCO|nr:hypothetical protein COCON_G00071010 [Conger conger]
MKSQNLPGWECRSSCSGDPGAAGSCPSSSPEVRPQGSAPGLCLQPPVPEIRALLDPAHPPALRSGPRALPRASVSSPVTPIEVSERCRRAVPEIRALLDPAHPPALRSGPRALPRASVSSPVTLIEVSERCRRGYGFIQPISDSCHLWDVFRRLKHSTLTDCEDMKTEPVTDSTDYTGLELRSCLIKSEDAEESIEGKNGCGMSREEERLLSNIKEEEEEDERPDCKEQEDEGFSPKVTSCLIKQPRVPSPGSPVISCSTGQSEVFGCSQCPFAHLEEVKLHQHVEKCGMGFTESSALIEHQQNCTEEFPPLSS